MGMGAWSSVTYTADTAAYRNMTREQIFDSYEAPEGFKAKNIEVRESRDSEDSPNSTALIFGLDVTGSMGYIAEHIAREGLGTLVEGILDTKPVSDPHIMMMAIGDINYDREPLQATQFEADNRISDQLTELYLEGGGGGNSYESYDLPWIFAADKTSIDCFEKRGKKGYLFTIGDERPPQTASPGMMKGQGFEIQKNTHAEDLLRKAQEKYDIFHVIVEEGSHMSYDAKATIGLWRKLLGKRAVLLKNHKHISEVIISVMRVSEGEKPEKVIESWQDPSVRKTVRHALFN